MSTSDYRNYTPPPEATMVCPSLDHFSPEEALDLDICMRLGYPVYYAPVHGYWDGPVWAWIAGNRLPHFAWDAKASRALVRLACEMGCDFHLDMETSGAVYAWFNYEGDDQLQRQTFAGAGKTEDLAVAMAFMALTLTRPVPPELVPPPPFW